MPKKSLENLTESMFYVLMAFCRGAMCGIQVAEFIEERTGGRIQMGPATLYTIIGKFEQEGYIREIAVEGRKRTYEITRHGCEAYHQEILRLHQCVADAMAEEEFISGTAASVQPFLGERGMQICPC